MNPETQQLIGYKWKVVVNGRRSLNGAVHSITIGGDVEANDEGADLFTVAAEIAENAREESEMEFPTSIQITLCPPKP